MKNKSMPTERGKIVREIMKELHKRYIDKDGEPEEIPSTKFYFDSFYNEVLEITREIISKH